MSDIVTRLRNWRNVHLARLHLLMEEAADQIAILESKLSLRENLEQGLMDGVARLQDEVRRLEEVIAASQRLGGCTPQLDCGADRKSVVSERCRDTGGQPFDSAPITLTDAERAAAVAHFAREFKGKNAATLEASETVSQNGDCPVPDNAAKQDNTPAANATPREGIEQDGCALTDAEREAVEQAIDAANGMILAEPWAIQTLRSLLERTK